MSSARTTIGTLIQDNDPRMTHRNLLRIVRVEYPRAYAVENPHGTREYPILLKSIHEDGKPRRSGFSVIQKGAGQ
jgi:hypothetical protein